MRTLLLTLLFTISSAYGFVWIKPELSKQYKKYYVTNISYNTASFTGVVNEYSMTLLGKFLKETHATRPLNTDINIILDSPGGSVFAGYKFIEIIRALQADGRKINGTVNGLCASMCFVILQTLNKRQSTLNSLIMQHNPSGGDEEVLNAIKRITQKMEADRIGINQRIWSEIVDGDLWLTAEEAKNMNVIDSVVLLKQKKYKKAPFRKESNSNDKKSSK
jgi:ATP-dependent protease ClpP protease subunit